MSRPESQTYNDGLCSVYSIENVAQPGYKPKTQATLKGQLRYEERKVGLTRAYLARQNDVQVERVLRCPWKDEVSTQDIVVPIDGIPYRIDLKQMADVTPKSMDLTLVRFTENFEVMA